MLLRDFLVPAKDPFSKARLCFYPYLDGRISEHLKILGKIEMWWVVPFFASHKCVASHCVRNRFQNGAVRRVTNGSGMAVLLLSLKIFARNFKISHNVYSVNEELSKLYSRELLFGRRKRTCKSATATANRKLHHRCWLG